MGGLSVGVLVPLDRVRYGRYLRARASTASSPVFFSADTKYVEVVKDSTNTKRRTSLRIFSFLFLYLIQDWIRNFFSHNFF